MGKLQSRELQKFLNCIKKHPKVLVPPALGFDSGVHEIRENRCLVISTDPCVNAPLEWFGWLLIHYAASDVALFGAKPEFCTITLLNSPSSDPHQFTEIMKQACSTTEKLNMAIIAGHTGIYDGISTPLGICTAYGFIDKDKLITPAGAKAGDAIILTKQIGLETIVNFTLTHKTEAEKIFGHARARELSKLIHMQTCVQEAFLLSGEKGIHAMHDTTEGGLIAALDEIASIAKVGFQIDFTKLPIPREVYALQEHFNLSQKEILSLSSTGTMIAAIDPLRETEVLQKLKRSNMQAQSIGVFTGRKERVLLKENRRTRFPRLSSDPYAKITLKL